VGQDKRDTVAREVVQRVQLVKNMFKGGNGGRINANGSHTFENGLKFKKIVDQLPCYQVH
jgi:K+-transporting ATPase A subunit